MVFLLNLHVYLVMLHSLKCLEIVVSVNIVLGLAFNQELHDNAVREDAKFDGDCSL